TSTTDAPSTTTSTAEIPTTSTEAPSTTLALREQMREAYLNFTERFNRTYSEDGLDNYVDNLNFISNDQDTQGETQFADLSLSELRKLVNKERDPKRE
ncbi:hypothetical protein PMAYCL1PPCAC_05650, partial [Pristionchus mayeri]